MAYELATNLRNPMKCPGYEGCESTVATDSSHDVDVISMISSHHFQVEYP